MPVPRLISRIMMLSVLAVALVTACSAVAAPTKDVSTKALMPNVSAKYTSFDTADFQGTFANMTAGGAALTGNVQIAALIKLADRIVGCYRNAGAFEASVYVGKADPTLAGGVLILNTSVMQDPKVLLSCLNPKQGANAPQTAFDPCTGHYTLNQNSKQYEVYYAGTQPQVCADFCSALQGCQAN
jgi:hypothetical protein